MSTPEETLVDTAGKPITKDQALRLIQATDKLLLLREKQKRLLIELKASILHKAEMTEPVYVDSRKKEGREIFRQKCLVCGKLVSWIHTGWPGGHVLKVTSATGVILGYTHATACWKGELTQAP